MGPSQHFLTEAIQHAMAKLNEQHEVGPKQHFLTETNPKVNSTEQHWVGPTQHFFLSETNQHPKIEIVQQVLKQNEMAHQ